jgi:hypothetical protein
MAFSTIDPEVSMTMTNRGRTVSACAAPAATRLARATGTKPKRDIKAFGIDTRRQSGGNVTFPQFQGLRKVSTPGTGG